MVVVFSDLGWSGPYLGQLRLVLQQYCPHSPVVDLMHDVPPFDAQAGAYLLAALASDLPAGSVVLGIVDPGVGGEREGVIVEADERWFVGPENGLFDRVAAHAATVRAWRIIWRTSRLSPTFHGRDIFAPVAGMLAAGTARADDLGDPTDLPRRQWPNDLSRIIHVDRFGNATTGIRSARLPPDTVLTVGAHRIGHAMTFEHVPVGDAFWYCNAAGLVALAVNRGRADVHLGLHIDTPVRVDATVGGGVIRPR